MVSSSDCEANVAVLNTKLGKVSPSFSLCSRLVIRSDKTLTPKNHRKRGQLGVDQNQLHSTGSSARCLATT